MDLYVKGMNLIFLILLIMSTLGLVSFILFFTTCPPKAERLKDNFKDDFKDDFKDNFKDELYEYPYPSESNVSEGNPPKITQMNEKNFNPPPNNYSAIRSLHKSINLDDLLH